MKKIMSNSYLIVESEDIDIKGNLNAALSMLTDIMDAPHEQTDYVCDKISVIKAITALKAALVWMENTDRLIC